MAPVKRSKKKNDLETPALQSQSISFRGTKRSAEEGEEDNSAEKRGRQDQKETGMLMENAGDSQNTNEKIGKELIEAEQESSDNSHSETSFMDLPNDVHTNIISFLDLPCRLNLRVNKRLDRIHFSVKAKLRRIKVKVHGLCSTLTMDNYSPIRSSNLEQWEEGLRRFALNTFVARIRISTDTDLNERQCGVIDALFHFKSDWLSTVSYRVCPWIPCHAPHLTLSSFLTLAQNVKVAKIDLVCSSLSVQDLCIIHKTMVEGCRMEKLSMFVERGMKKSFIEECFGITIEKVTEPRRGTIYRSAVDSLELYVGFGRTLRHFEGNLRTTVDCFNKISFEKLEVVKKPDDKYKLKLNHVYGHGYYEDDDSDEDEEESEYDDEEDSDD